MIKSKIIWLQISYWVAAIADFAIAISVLIPERVGLTEYVYPMGLMSAVAVSWGILLLIASKKPLERRWILIPTIIVIFLLSAVRVYASLQGIISFSIGYLIFAVLIMSVIGFSYINSNNLVEK
jgi:hypothetical protein